MKLELDDEEIAYIMFLMKERLKYLKHRLFVTFESDLERATMKSIVGKVRIEKEETK